MSTVDNMDIDGEDNGPLMEPVDVPSDPQRGPGIWELKDEEMETPAASPKSSPERQPAPAEEPPEARVEPFRGEYLWEVHDFAKLHREQQREKHFSDVFEAGGFYWNILLFPRGNKGIPGENVSVFLNVPDSDGPHGYMRRTKFWIEILNLDPSKNFIKEAKYDFHYNSHDWGFADLAKASEILEPRSGYLVDGILRIRARIEVEHPDNYIYNSKLKTGFVGLKNQGATCYMNSLLQTLYNINYFRQAVYHMPTTEDETPSKSIPLALQSLFYKLQFGSQSVSTKALTQSFGWTSMDAFTQHDVQELNRILSDKLEEKMKGTKVEGTIGKLFEGKMHNFVECINVPYKSTRQEVDADLQLLVKGCKNMYDSFDKYVESEDLTGQNQYMAEGHGMQDAKMGILFDSFPPVLQIQLRRFEYDFMKDVMIKINDRYEFPEELDLDRDNGKYLSENADRSIRNKYRLHSVLVHSGGIHGGHYYAYCNPSGSQWLKFDDDKVTKEDARQAMNDQYGGQDEPVSGNYNHSYRGTKFSNAYMLVYVRESEWENIMCEVTKDDLSRHVRERMEAEQLEKERVRREKEESHLHTVVRVARNKDMVEQIGRDNFFFDLVDHDTVKEFRVRKYSKFKDFKRLVAEELGVAVDRQLWWGWAKRVNHSYRPYELFTEVQDEMYICAIKEEPASKLARSWPRLNLYLQEPANEKVLQLMRQPTEKLIMIFLKKYHPREGRLEFLREVMAPVTNAPLRQLLPLICQHAGLSMDDAVSADGVLLYEEVRRVEPLIQLLDLETDLGFNQISHGDIFIVQERLSEEEEEQVQFPRVPEFLYYMLDRIMVTFKPLESPSDAGATLELSCQMAYEDVAQILAKELKLENQNHLRFTMHNTFTQAPRPQPVSWSSVERGMGLNQLLCGFNNIVSDILYYEVLDLPLQDFEKLKPVKIQWHNHKGEQVAEHKVRVLLDSSVGQLLEKLKEVEPEARDAPALRLMEVLHSKIYKVFEGESLKDSVVDLNDNYWIYRAEAVPREQLELEDGGRVLNLSHVSLKDDKRVTLFGDSITTDVGPGETMGQLAARIQRRLEIPDAEFAKWKFCIIRGISASAADWLEPEDDVLKMFDMHLSTCLHSNEQSYIGMVHSVTHSKKTPSRTPASSHEQAIKIK